MTDSLVYIDSVPKSEQPAFTAKVKEVGGKLEANPDHLMQVMHAESGIKPDIRNTSFPSKDSSGNVAYATGLIQFMPSTAKAMGTTTKELEKMSRVQQMDYVYQYLKPYAGRLKTYFDVYLAVFFPAAIGHSDDDNYVFEAKNLSRASIAKANPTMDINKDGKITMGEFKQYLKNTVKNKSIFDKIFGSASETIVETAKNVIDTGHKVTEKAKKNPVVTAIIVTGMLIAFVAIIRTIKKEQ